MVGRIKHKGIVINVLSHWASSDDIRVKTDICCLWKKQRTKQHDYSLVPRPFLPPVFDRLQYAKTEGEGLGDRVMCVMSSRCDRGGTQSS